MRLSPEFEIKINRNKKEKFNESLQRQYKWFSSLLAVEN